MDNAFAGLVRALSLKVRHELEITGGVKVYVDFDDFALRIEYLPEAEQLLLAAPIFDVPATGREALYRALLQGNFLFVGTHGTTLALDNKESFITLQLFRDMAALTQDNFPLLVEGFLNAAQEWRDRCLALGGKAEGSPRDAESGQAQVFREEMALRI